MSAIRVLVADDDTLLREGVASVLEKAGFEVVGRAGDATALLELVRTESPNLVVVDIRMPPTHTTEGLEAAQKIRGEHPGIGVLVLSAHVEVEYAAELITSGDGVGYLLKSRIGDVGEFADACTRVAGGGSIVDPELVRELLSASATSSTTAATMPRRADGGVDPNSCVRHPEM
ncbi:Putative two-component system response regulator, LuxR family [Mycobacteroides abscessus subsp. abscessus]|nr:Putative two-component system response regulator, LuxR family [Mycobacteroides abscessus subsp. abscessus]